MPPPGSSRSVGVAFGSAILVVALVLLVGVVGVTLLGRSPSTDAAGPPLEATPGPSPAVSEVTSSGPCGDVPAVTSLPGPTDPTLLVSPSFVESLDVSVFERGFGTMSPTGGGDGTSGAYYGTTDEVVRVLRSSDIDARRAELDRDGFRGAAWRTWTSSGGDSVAVFLQELGDPDAATRYAAHHLAQDCIDSSSMARSTVLPGAVEYVNQNDAGNPQVQLVAVVGDTEVNVTICACRPTDQSLAVAGSWLVSLVESVAPGPLEPPPA